MNGFFADAGILIVNTVFGLYIFSVLLRFLFQLVRADFYNPFSQFLVRFTNPPLLPLRRVVPGFGGIDLASIVLLLTLETLRLYLVAKLQGVSPAFVPLFVLAIFELVETTLWIFIIAVFVRVLASWFSPHSDNPLMDLLVSLTEPLMRPARRLIPPISGLDLSPIAVLLLLQIGLLLVGYLQRGLFQGLS